MSVSCLESTCVEGLSIGEATIRCSLRLEAAFKEFHKAQEYATELQTDLWDFAVAMPSLRRLKVFHNDLRWLVAKGFVEHALEVTMEGESKRRFQLSPGLSLRTNSCFVLTPAGAEVVRAMSRYKRRKPHQGLDSPGIRPISAACGVGCRSATPIWDDERQELRVGEVVVKRFRVPAASQETVLAAFEEEAWPQRIDDPLPPRSDLCRKRRLQETIKSLNRNQKQPLIRFLGDGSAEGILWEFCGDAAEVSPSV